MKSQPQHLRYEPHRVPDFPGWAKVRGASSSDIENGYLAGASVLSLDQIVRMEPLWEGVWRRRLALKASAVASRTIGRTSSEHELRDGFLFKAQGDDPGPSGHILLAFRKLVDRRPSLSREGISGVLDHFEINWTGKLDAAMNNVEQLLMSSRPAPLVAADVASEIYHAEPSQEVLAHWLADAAFATKMRWPNALPLLTSEVHGPHFRTPGERRRTRPGEAGWISATVLAYGAAAQAAHQLASDLSTRAEKILSVAPSLRAKGAGQVITLLLGDDAVSASWSGSMITSRGVRRLFDRLSQAEAVRELSGRSAFRVYGL